MLFALIHHPLDSNPLAHYGPAEKLAKQGWVCHAFQFCSGVEYRAVKEMAETNDDIYVTSVQRVRDSATIEGSLAYFSTTDFSVFAKTPELLQSVIDHILALPQRNAEIILRSPEAAKTASLMARGLNHRMTVLSRDDDYPESNFWVLSIEDTIQAVQIKLSVG
jgi:hypothetical protein